MDFITLRKEKFGNILPEPIDVFKTTWKLFADGSTEIPANSSKEIYLDLVFSAPGNFRGKILRADFFVEEIIITPGARLTVKIFNYNSSKLIINAHMHIANFQLIDETKQTSLYSMMHKSNGLIILQSQKTMHFGN